MPPIAPYWQAALLIFVYMTAWFIPALIRKNNGLADVAWGLGFVLVAWYSWGAHYPERFPWLAVPVSLWGLRLSAYLALRNFGKQEEDWRYAQWREEWGRWAFLRSYLQVFLLQGALMWLICFPFFQVSENPAFPIWVQIIGGILFLFGWIWETVADVQLRRFKKDPANKGQLLTSGLWGLSRHPNYFGEIVLWWGIFLLSLPYGNWWLSLLSPLVVTWLLTRVSGVPLLEGKWADDPDYRAYRERTNALWPRIF